MSRDGSRANRFGKRQGRGGYPFYTRDTVPTWVGNNLTLDDAALIFFVNAIY